MVIYNEIPNTPNSRLVRLKMKSIQDLEDISCMANIGNTANTPVVENQRFGYRIYGSFGLYVVYCRSIDWFIRYRQMKKLFALYAALGGSIYFHNFSIGNTKRRDMICANVFANKIKLTFARTSSSPFYAKLVFNAEHMTMYHKMNVSIDTDINSDDKAQLEEYTRKSSFPIATFHSKKTDYNMERCGSNDNGRIVVKSTRISTIHLKPVQLQMKNVKGMIGWEYYGGSNI